MAAVVTMTMILTNWFTPTKEPVVSGNIKFYNPGVMEKVAVNRGYITNTLQYKDWLAENNIDGAISMMRYGDIGRKVYLLTPDNGLFRVIVIDCVEKKHYPRRVKQNDIAEVDWGLAKHLGMKGVIKGAVWFNLPTFKQKHRVE